MKPQKAIETIEIGDAVRFAHEPETGRVYYITGTTTMTPDHSLMVMLDELPGEFAPHCFVKVS